MSSLRKLESARNNGAKSSGPITIEGKARSSMNGLKHGFSAANVVLKNEDLPQFEKLLNGYIETFKPLNEPERNLVDQMAMATWRLFRIYAAETEIFDAEMDASNGYAAKLKELADASKLIPLMLRYEANARRQFERALRSLNELRKLPEPPFLPPKNVNVYFCPQKEVTCDNLDTRPAECPQNLPEPSEPNPISEHTPNREPENYELPTTNHENAKLQQTLR